MIKLQIKQTLLKGMENTNTVDKPTIGITIGDINGIGPEVIIKALADSRLLNYMTPVIYGSTKSLSFYKKAFKVDEFNYSQYKEDSPFNSRKVNVVNCWNEMINISVGEEAPEGGKSAFLALERAVEDYKKGLIDALVTGPINKNLIQGEQFRFPGHTEYLAEKFGARDSLMTMVSGSLKIGVVTGHIPLKDISAHLTKDKIKSKLNILLKSLKQDFGILKPRIAVLGVNPHAGENGLLGDEEEQVIAPAMEEFKNKGALVYGPYPADGFFGAGQFSKFDAILAMYHDQGLIPFKTLAFETGVNFTAGLPIIRTSPDHGAAYNIAGKDLADYTSMREAIYLAIDVYKKRKEIGMESANK